jgi:hypothetical protein
MTATPRSLARSLASRTGRGLGKGETLALRGRSSSEAEAEAASRVSPFSRLAFPAFLVFLLLLYILPVGFASGTDTGKGLGFAWMSVLSYFTTIYNNL